MRSPARFLQSSDPSRPAEPPAQLPFDSDVVVILAALLCALICVVGLALVARCACLRRAAAAAAAAAAASSSSSSYPSPPNKGLKKKVVQALPTLSFDSSSAGAAAGAADPEAGGGVRLVDCAICLAEFADGDVVRVLPQCGHGFHAECVDTWLRSHSSCPSCRRILVVPAPTRCRECGASSGVTSAAKAAVGRGSSTFLP